MDEAGTNLGLAGATLVIPGRIGVVTVTFNSADVLSGFLSSLAAQTHTDFLLFAVDNASKDATLEILGNWLDNRLRILANSDNRGVAGANNQGILAALAAGCSSVLLLNNDTEFEAELLSKLAHGLKTHRVEMSCPKMMYFDEPQRIWTAGGAFRSWLGCHSYHVGEDEIDHGQYDRPALVTYVPTCCVLIQKEVFDRIGLMDERYFVYADDMDFMYRALRAGVKLIYLPEAKLLHKVGRLTGGSESAFSIRFGTRNRVFFLLKYFGRLRTLPWIMIRQITWTLAVLSGKKSTGWLKQKNSALLEAWRMHRDSIGMRRQGVG